MIYLSIKSILISVKKNRLFYSINLVGLIAGMLVLTIIFTFVFEEFSIDSFHKNANNIYRIHSGGYATTPPCFAEKLRNKIPEINAIIRLIYNDLAIIEQNKEISIENTYYVDPEIFKIFSFNLLSGEVDKVLHEPYSIVINLSTAKQLFGIDYPIGKTILDKNGVIYTITGVMEDIPYNSHIQSNAFISMETLRYISGDQAFDCSSWSILTYIHTIENSNINEVETKINSILEDFRFVKDDDAFILKLQPLMDVYFDYENNKFDTCKHGNFQTVIIYIAISFLLMLIVIINYIDMTTSLSTARIKEIAVRKIYGASRIDIIKQILFEAFGAVLISTIIVMVVIELFLPKLCGLLNISISESLNRSVLYLYYFVGIILIGLTSGIIPGIIIAKINEIKALKNEAFINLRGFQRKALFIVQLIIMAIFLNATLIATSQINYIFEKDLGFDYKNVVYFNLDKVLLDKKEVLKENLLRKPEIELVSFSNGIIGKNFSIQPFKHNSIVQLCSSYTIDPDYISLYKMDMKLGRDFSWDLTSDSNNFCIINEEACKVFNLLEPIGKKLYQLTITGVVCDYNFTSLHNQIQPLVLRYGNDGGVIQIKISTENQEEIIDFIKNTCSDISPDFDCNFSFLESQIKELYKSELDLKNSFKAYSIIAFAIALLGLFALSLFIISKKTKEITIRKIFGAKLAETFKLLAKEQLWIVLISNILAIPITYFVMNYWLNNFYFRIDIGFIVYLKTFLIIIILTLLAISFLVLKTYRISTIQSLNIE